MTDAMTTVDELVQFIDRARMALTEAGRPDLAENAHVIVTSTGVIRLSCAELRPGTVDPALVKFVSLDPQFERAQREAGS